MAAGDAYVRQLPKPRNRYIRRAAKGGLGPTRNTYHTGGKRLSSGARRRKAQDRNPLYNPAAVLSGHDLVRAAKTLTGYEFGPQLSENARQARQARAQGNRLVGNAGRYYRQLAKGEAARVARQKALGVDLSKELAGIASQSGRSFDRASADTRAAQQQDAAVRGPGLSGGGEAQTLEEIAAQRARSGATAGAYRSTGALETANYGGLVNALGGATRLHGAEVRRELVNRRENQLQDLRTARRGLRTQEGQGRLKNVLSLRQSGFDNAVTLRGLGLKQEDIQSRAQTAAASAALAGRRQTEVERNNRRQARLAKQRNRTTLRGQNKSSAVARGNLRERQRHDRSLERNKGGGSGSKSKESQSSHNVKSQVDDARSFIRRARARGWHGPKITRNATKNKVRPLILNVARDLEYLGYVSAPNRAALRRAGVRIPKAWRHKPKRARDNSFGNLF